MSNSYEDKKSQDQAMVTTLLRNLDAYLQEEKATIMSLAKEAQEKIGALDNGPEDGSSFDFMDNNFLENADKNPDIITKQYQKKINKHEKNIENVEKLQDILLSDRSNKLKEFHKALKRLDRAAQKHILPPAKSPSPSVLSNGLFANKMADEKAPTGSYQDQAEKDSKTVQALIANLLALKKEEKANIKKVPGLLHDELTSIEDHDHFETAKQRITQKYDEKLAKHTENITNIDELLNILITANPPEKLQKFYAALEKWQDGPMQQRILAMDKSPTGTAPATQVASAGPQFSDGLFQAPPPPPQPPKAKTDAEVAIADLFAKTEKYIEYLNKNKISPLRDEYREQYRLASLKNTTIGTESSAMKKITALYTKKIAKYEQEAEKIGDLRKALRGKEGDTPKTKLANFQTAFTQWKEQDMKWRMFRSRGSRGKGLFSLQVKKTMDTYHKKTNPAPAPTFRWPWKKR